MRDDRLHIGPETHIGTETLRRHLLDAEAAIAEVNRQIAERERYSIPAIALQEELEELVSAWRTLRARLGPMIEDP
jgi:hypothetical protein